MFLCLVVWCVCIFLVFFFSLLSSACSCFYGVVVLCLTDDDDDDDLFRVKESKFWRRNIVFMDFAEAQPQCQKLSGTKRDFGSPPVGYRDRVLVSDWRLRPHKLKRFHLIRE